MSPFRFACLALASLAPVSMATQVVIPTTFGQLPDGFYETFALATDRGATLEALLPGTIEHHYFSCLHLQQQGRLDDVDALMEGWRKSYGENRDYKQIEARQAFLRASSDPAATYRFLERELGLRFDDKRRLQGQSPKLPTTLDNGKISTEWLLTSALRSNSRGTYEAMDPTLLESLVTRKLRSNQRRWLLDLLPRPDVPGLLELVIQDLAEHKSNTFGRSKIHSKLSLAQLEQLRAARPEVLSNKAYVDTVMRRLAPRFPESADDRDDQLAYLQRAYSFATRLPSTHISLKAHLLYRWIEWDLEGGTVNEERLLEYLRMPRATRYYVRPQNQRLDVAQLNKSFRGVTPFPAIGQEESLVTACLLEIFRTETKYDRFVGVLEENYVKRTFAEARLLYGDGADADTYVAMLGAAQAEALRARVDIEFARTNPKDLGANDAVTLQVEVKNVDRMLVKVFEIDPVAYFDRFSAPVTSNLDLDGLVANDTQLLEFDAPPMSRVRREIPIPSLAKPGTYVVELIGGGVSSRAVVIKGQLRLLERPTPMGHSLLVLDGAGEPVPGAVVRFGGRDYAPDKDGRILVPYSPAASNKSVLIRSGDMASVTILDHEGEAYRLKASVHTPLEGLLAGMEATIVARPQLRLNGRSVPLGLLEDASLLITAQTQDGTTSMSVVDGLSFEENGDVIHKITVPERAASISVRLSGSIRSMSQGADVELQADTTTFPVHALHQDAPFHSYLTKNPEGFALDILGRAGEPLVDAEVRLEFDNRLLGRSELVRLKTDENGRVLLGALRDVDSVRLKSPSSMTNAWHLESAPALGLPGRLHGRTGQTLRVPCRFRGDVVTRSEASLLAIDRSGGVIADHFDALRADRNYVALENLPEGEYRLVLKRFNQTFWVTILEGQTRFGHVVGDNEAIEVVDPLPLQIIGISQGEDSIDVQLGGMSSSARVYVVATRYMEPVGAHPALALPGAAGPSATRFGGLFTTYESGREISDEYRYILDRRLIDPYPGNMLARPGYLLNPWALQETADNMAAGGAGGGRFGGKRNLRAGGSTSDSPFDGIGQGAARAAFAGPDFLNSGAVFLTDLKPDEDGVVRIPIDELGNKHMVQIVAMDDSVAVDELLLRGEAPLDLRERRLVDALDADAPMTQQRRIEFIAAGEEYVIRDAPNAGAKTFGSLSDVFELYRTSGSGGEELAQFEFMTRWPSLTELEKRTKYSEFACHELHLFLRERDPEFFESLVVPHLSSKGHATFMDDWLLGRDLTAYLEPWRFEQLNVMELILLLRETGGDAAAITRDMLALLPPNAFSLDASFAEILSSRGLEASQSSLGIALENTRKQAVKNKLSALGYAGDPEGSESEVAAQPSTDDFFLGRGQEDAEESVARSRVPAIASEFTASGTKGKSMTRGLELEEVKERRKAVEGFFYRDLAKTVEYAETHYWRARLSQMNAGFVTVSPFWVDFANAGAEPFVSAAFPMANRSVNEKLLALALLDLPFESTEPAVAADGRSVTLTATTPTFLALEDIAPAAPEEGGSVVLVGQDFFDPARRTEVVDGVQRDVFVTEEFLKGVPYGCRMVVTNPSSSQLDMQLLVQIPEGAIALGRSQMTDGIPVTLTSYGTTSVETFFYFPISGSYHDYPVHAGRGNVLLGAAEPTTLNVVEKATIVDKTTWDWISQNAELPELLNYLEGANVRELGLGAMAWRMANQPSFVAVTDALAARGVYPDELWKYAIRHKDALRAQRFLEGQEKLVQRVGAPFQSPLFSLEPRSRRAYEHLAYEPLVNGRTHAFAADSRILNEQFKAQYSRFLATLASDTDMDSEEKVELVYYLFLQDRITEALETFDTIDPASLRTQVQYDYMRAYVAFYRSDVEAARGVAEAYKDYPVDLWRSRFRNVLAQADEIEGVAGNGNGPDPDDRDQSQGTLAGLEPLLAAQVEGGQVMIAVEGIDEVEVRFHRMDVEFLFSNSPFVRGDQGAFGVIRPSEVLTIPVAKGETALSVTLPDVLRTANVVVEVRGGGISRQATYFAGDLSVQGIERYGQVRVLESQGGAALPKAYVKVYALLEDGQVRFHKDGYTDLRGRFDYVSLSGVSGAAVERFALLVMHDEAGASMLELAPPAR